MLDYIKRILIAGFIALCISLLFLGGRQASAESIIIEEATSDWIWPADGIITDTYGTRNGTHKGIDIAGAPGTPVYAVDGGKVSKSYYSSTYGHVVFIEHPNQLETVYAHLRKRYVREGQVVNKGDMIGEMGSTGDSSGSHLHFEVHKYKWTADKKNAVDPMLALENVQRGESVQAMKKVEKNGRVMAAATEFSREESSEEKVEKPAGSREMTVKDRGNGEKEPPQTGNEFASGVKVDKIIHFVRPGENLTVIAKQYDSSVKHIQEANNLQSDKIYSGQKLVIEPEGLYEYTVRPGDNLSSIAKKAGVTVEHLMSENGLRSDLIRPGQKLFYRHSKR